MLSGQRLNFQRGGELGDAGLKAVPRDVGDAAGPLGLKHRLSGHGRKVSPVNANGRDPIVEGSWPRLGAVILILQGGSGGCAKPRPGHIQADGKVWASPQASDSRA